MTRKRPASNKQTRVDRLLDKVKSNPIVAAALIIGTGVVGLASFSDSVIKLAEDLPKLVVPRQADFAGKWMSVERDAITTVPTVLVFDFKTDHGYLSGTVNHGYPQALTNGKVEGSVITFEMNQEWMVGDKTEVERHAYRGRLVGDKIHFIRTIEGEPPFEFTAVRKSPQPLPAALRSGGRLARTRMAFDTFKYLYVMNADGSERKQLTRGRSPTWSPDGSEIAYVGENEENTAGVYVVKVDGAGSPRRLLKGSWEDPAWSPDGRRLLVSNDGSYESPGIYSVDPDGSKLTLLVPEHWARAPAFSPDGKHMLYCVKDEVVVVDADGLRRRELGKGHHPAWSPAGSQIAFVRDGDENSSQVVVVNADGSHPVLLTEDWARATSPAWSPDGSMIAFISNRQGESEIFVMNSDGTNPVNVSNELKGYENVVWSPPLRR